MKEFNFELIDSEIQKILYNSLGDIERNIIYCLYFQKLSEEKTKAILEERYEELFTFKEIRKRKNTALKQMGELYLMSEREKQASESLENFLNEFEKLEKLEDIKEVEE